MMDDKYDEYDDDYLVVFCTIFFSSQIYYHAKYGYCTRIFVVFCGGGATTTTTIDRLKRPVAEKRIQ